MQVRGIGIREGVGREHAAHLTGVAHDDVDFKPGVGLNDRADLGGDVHAGRVSEDHVATLDVGGDVTETGLDEPAGEVGHGETAMTTHVDPAQQCDRSRHGASR